MSLPRYLAVLLTVCILSSGSAGTLTDWEWSGTDSDAAIPTAEQRAAWLNDAFLVSADQESTLLSAARDFQARERNPYADVAAQARLYARHDLASAESDLPAATISPDDAELLRNLLDGEHTPTFIVPTSGTNSLLRDDTAGTPATLVAIASI
jgi:hypothetical protein